MEKLAPLGNNVFVKPVTAETMTRGGIFLPDTAKDRPQEGEIIAAGPGKINKKGDLLPMDVKVGDHVIFAKYTGSEIKIDGEKYLIMPESDILAVKVDEKAPKAKEPRAAESKIVDVPTKSKARGKK